MQFAVTPIPHKTIPPSFVLKTLLLNVILLSNLSACSQVNDYLSLKKKSGRTVVNFYAGSPISIQTKTGALVHSTIHKIINDSLYLQLYQITSHITPLGTKIYDTLTSYIFPIHYLDIEKIFRADRYNAKGLAWWVSKRVWIAALGYIALNIINSGFSLKRITEQRNIKNLGIAGAIFIPAFIVDKSMKVNDYRKGRFKIVYVNLN